PRPSLVRVDLPHPMVPPPLPLLSFPQQPVDAAGLRSSPTRRSSDLAHAQVAEIQALHAALQQRLGFARRVEVLGHLLVIQAQLQDRKSTRLNSSHVKISYAVFCLTKKKPMSIRSALANLSAAAAGGA